MTCCSSAAAGGCRLTLRLLLALLLGLTAASLPGCRGCLPENPLARLKREDAEKKRQPEKPKPDFEIDRPMLVPCDDNSLRQQLVKHGHWVMAIQPMKANNFDFQGEVESACIRTSGDPIGVPNTAFRVKTARPAALPKGQQKLLETTHFLIPPPRLSDEFRTMPRVSLETRLRARRGGREMAYGREPTTGLSPYQYFLVVLSDNADRYANLNLMATVLLPLDDDQDQLLDTVAHYRVLLPETKRYVPIPSQPLAWTSIAHVIWDGLNPHRLTAAQQQAVIDWLHWGGQMVISGPESLDQLRGSFLDEYLPALAGSALQLGPERFEQLDQSWSVANDRNGERAVLAVGAERPLVGVELQPRPGAADVGGTGGLVLERRVGAGRIVVTAFPLAARQIKNWGSFDSFLNSGLLRRPHRRFLLNPTTQMVNVEWADFPGHAMQLDPRFVTNLRYFTRDASQLLEAPAAVGRRSESAKRFAGEADVAPALETRPALPLATASEDAASWNDASGAAEAARTALRDAAGISIPKSGFVLRVLAIYLLVLVPVNWAVFRAIGRVEWAWLAAPLIAITGAVAVVRLARLDIGFASSRTEIGVMELQGGYGRGHLTRYTALYTSLSTNYQLGFDNDSAVALPFPIRIPWARSPLDPVQTITLRRERDLALSDFQVASNSTGMVHSEVMHELGGQLDLRGDAQRGWTLRNATSLSLKDAGLLRCDPQGRIHLGWLGDVPPAASRRVEFVLADDQVRPYFAAWSDSPTAYSYERQAEDLLRRLDSSSDGTLSKDELEKDRALAAYFGDSPRGRQAAVGRSELQKWSVASREGDVVLGRLLELASNQWRLQPGDCRLVAWTDQEFPGLSVQPRPSQTLLKTVVIAHLARGDWAPAKPDANLKAPYDRPDELSVDELEALLP